MKKIILILLAFISFNSYSQYQYLGSGSTTTKLLLHLNGNSLDASGNANNGTDSLITYGLAYGKFNQGASFNGTASKIKFADSSSLRPTGDFTVSLWIKLSSATDGTSFQSFSNILYRAGFSIRTSITTGFVVITTGNNTGTVQGINWDALISTISVNDGKWHLITFVLTSSSQKMYIDGNLNISKAGIGYLSYNTTNFVRVGSRNITGDDNTFFNGSLDELFLDGKEWTSSEIKRFYTYQRGMYDNK